MRSRTAISVLTVWAAGYSTAASSQDSAAERSYPHKPIRIVVGQAPGGATDIVARSLAVKLTEALGQSVVIDNRSGAAGSIGSAIVAKSAPDGYTALIVSSTYTINPSLYRKLPFGPVKDLQPVTLIASSPFLLMVHPSIPAKTTKELIALAKMKPLTYGSGGIGSSGHLAAELFSSMAGVEFTHVPYKGAGPALIDTLGGQVNLILSSIVSGMPFAKSGKLRALAITTRARSIAMPDLSTIAESALPGYDFSSWYGLMVPTGTPKQIAGRLYTETTQALRTPDLRQRLSNEGCEPVGNTPAEFAAYIALEMTRWAKVVKASGMQAE